MNDPPTINADQHFRAGVRAAVQAAVDDIAGLVKRRNQAGANESTTQIITGIGRRIANLPMPASEEQGTVPMDRGVLLSKVARLIYAVPDWDRVSSISTTGEFYDEKGMALESSDLLRAAWQRADEIVTLVRYA